MTRVAGGVAVCTVVGLAALVAIMFLDAGRAEEVEWSRKVYLLSGVEALAFAGAGFLFGKEVHRQQAADSQARLVKADQLLEDSHLRAMTLGEEKLKLQKDVADVAARAFALRRDIGARKRFLLSLQREPKARVDYRGGTAADGTDSATEWRVLNELDDLASALFPEAGYPTEQEEQVSTTEGRRD